MRRTNSKETMEAIKNAIMESYEAAENARRITTGGGFCVSNLDRVTLPGV